MPLDASPAEPMVDDLELRDGVSEAVKAFELGRQIGAKCGVTDDNYWRGYSEGIGDGFNLGRLDEDERADVIERAIGEKRPVWRDLQPTPIPARAHRIRPISRLPRHRRPGRAQ
ncbi:MAG TPA: hypothetical protein VIR00_08400 [Micromonosporaceae bacterium]